MVNELVLYVSGLIPIIWGAVHIIKTKSVVAEFGELSQDNTNILTMEWVYEGITLLFLGMLVILVTFVGDSQNTISVFVYWSVIVMLIIMAIWSFFTGFKVDFIAYKLCIPIFTASAILILLGLVL